MYIAGLADLDNYTYFSHTSFLSIHWRETFLSANEGFVIGATKRAWDWQQTRYERLLSLILPTNKQTFTDFVVCSYPPRYLTKASETVMPVSIVLSCASSDSSLVDVTG
jgi:hypothetical protein